MNDTASANAGKGAPCTRGVILMGVSGTGKTTVGRAFTDRFGWRFVDADDLHPPANKAKMARGEPLNDDDRWPWLDAVRRHLVDAVAHREGPGLIVGCSALRRVYRDRLRRPDEPIALAFLQARYEDLRERLKRRGGHFFPLALLDSQFATLEPPTDDEKAIPLDATRPVPALVDTLGHGLGLSACD